MPAFFHMGLICRLSCWANNLGLMGTNSIIGQNLDNPEERRGGMEHPSPPPFPAKSSPLPSGAWVRIAYGKRLSRWEPAASRNLTPSVQPPICQSVCPFLLCPHPIRSTISLCPRLSPIVEQQGPFLYPLGNGNKLSTAGDVGCRTGWHTPPEKGSGWGWA